MLRFGSADESSLFVSTSASIVNREDCFSDLGGSPGTIMI